jgi:hypothetical protein
MIDRIALILLCILAISILGGAIVLAAYVTGPEILWLLLPYMGFTGYAVYRRWMRSTDWLPPEE